MRRPTAQRPLLQPSRLQPSRLRLRRRLRDGRSGRKVACRVQKVFFLERGAPAYADRFRLAPEEAIRLVRGAGGAAALAHPYSTRYDRAELRAFVARLAEAGLAGIEAYYTGHLPGQVEELLGLAHDFGLVATGGSDFHGDPKPAVRVGVAYGGLKVPDEAFDGLLARLA